VLIPVIVSVLDVTSGTELEAFGQSTLSGVTSAAPPFLLKIAILFAIPQNISSLDLPRNPTS
jgi:hypothetical protein